MARGAAIGIAVRARSHLVLGDCVSPATCGHERIPERSYLFTMSEITHPRAGPRGDAADAENVSLRTSRPVRLVEPDGIEPTTSCLQSRRSPN
jgi:hypothetical protein